MKVNNRRSSAAAVHAEFLNALREVLGKDPLYSDENDGKVSPTHQAGSLKREEKKRERKRQAK